MAYNPATGTWAPTGSMTTPREGHDATLLPDGDVLVTAGVETAGVFSELYNPSTGQWSAAVGGLAACGTATECRFGSTAVLLGTGNVLVTGGLACPAPSSTPLTAAPGAWVAPSQAPGALTPGNRQSQGRGSVQPALKF